MQQHPTPFTYAEILLPLPVAGLFTYALPGNMDVQQGSWVEVPFGNRRLTGVIWKTDNTPTIDTTKIKPVIRVYDAPPLSDALRKFIGWVAEYNLAPLGMVFKMVMSSAKALEPLPDKTEIYYRLGDTKQLKLTKARKEVITLLEQHTSLPAQTLIAETKVSMAVIKAMAEAGMLVAEEYVSELLSQPEAIVSDITLPPLSPAQAEATALLKEKLNAGYSATLLDGVTGSGKTEVYFALIHSILQDAQGQVLIMLPEIMLTNQLITRFKERFGFAPAVWHSNITPKQKRETWRGVAEGRVRLVIGARSALFLPFKALALMVVDEEHDGSYKQEEGVVYHARDMAVVRASLEQIPIILASATPALETLFNVQNGKFQRIPLPSRYGGAVLPDVEIIDMRNQHMERQSWVSPMLRQRIAETIAKGKQALLYLNRRGYAPLTLCRSCGHRLQCPHCASWLVEHRRKRQGLPPAVNSHPQQGDILLMARPEVKAVAQSRLQCHHCGYHAALPESCSECKEEHPWIACGPGVERIAEEVEQFLPGIEKVLITSDTLATPKQAEEAIAHILSGEAKVIIGTQMIAKGHHFPNLTLVGVVDADLGLSGGDVRAVERTYQLLHQVAGRAGREQDKGLVVIQSYNPDSPVLKALESHRRDDFVTAEMASRNRHAMPPIGRLAAIIISGKNETEVLKTAKNLVKSAPVDKGLVILGPVPAPLSYLRGKYRYRILIKTEKQFPLQKLLKFWLMSASTPDAIQVKVDIDPYNFF